MEKRFTCVVCPIGCELHIEYDENNISPDKCTVTGNTCPRGEKYAKTEIVNPERTLTSTVKSDSKELPMIPVKTTAPIPKEKLFEAMKLLNSFVVSVPVRSGYVLMKDFMAEGVDLIVCRSVDK